MESKRWSCGFDCCAVDARNRLFQQHRPIADRPTQEPTWLFFQCDKNATSAKQIACGAQELCILRLLRLPCAIYSFILLSASSRRFIRDGSVAETYRPAHFAA